MHFFSSHSPSTICSTRSMSCSARRRSSETGASMSAQQATDDSEIHRLPTMTTGNPHLDQILGGGFPANSINIVMGEPGSGKTVMVEQLAFANAGEDRPVLYLTTLSEPLEKVVRYLQRFAFFD